KMQVEAGARIVQIFDSWGGELSPYDYERFCLPYLSRMVKELHATGVPVILFGVNMSNHLSLLKSTGADVIGVDWKMPIDEARRILGNDVAVQGNLDPLHLFLPREELDARVQDILRRAGATGHIFNLGHGILPPTDPEAAKFLVDAVHKHGAELLREGA
ncbi:MAG TPA: uroporphyrinogen decarboxylase family protein, partial [Myxococcaceae bacterium]|nr:uroporphyrinogen decarboxylase family protein [Myxococcaceae bacterium]